MTPLKKYFTGEVEPPRHRMTTCQKCIRTPDIERVGITARHGTYFEMLGNFSFGDYFKHDAIHWAWEFITGEQWLDLPKDKLWVTVYLDDDEAYDIWNKEIGVDESRIVRLGKEDNFWEHGAGPCGPCSEIHFDRGVEYGCGKPDCKPGCDCDRFMEFWNLVFTQFDNDGKNNYTRLAKPNIDTGMGLERLACLMQGVNNLFEVDTVRNIMLAISSVAGVSYGEDPKTDISLRVITDHIRSTTFLICDGVIPSNEGRGYVLRRLLRRAARHGRLLGIRHTFLSDIVDIVARENRSEYPELTEKADYIKKVVALEEERFAQTIDTGLEILESMLASVKEKGETVLGGEDVFRLNDTFGFPIDLTREIAAEQNITLDEDGFQARMAEQKSRARAATKALGDFGWASEKPLELGDTAQTEFVGYDKTEAQGKIIALFDPESSEAVAQKEGGKILVVLDRTPFYGEGGGQVGDTGMLTAKDATVRVLDTKKSNGVYLHICEIESGALALDQEVTASVDALRRAAIQRNHSAAHLLQAALRKVLGNHVEQAGSYVDANRVRFDFTHFAALTAQELEQVEAAVNEEILRGETIITMETDMETAKANGAMALFGEKYGKTVRMVKMGDFSCELCGGTHLDNTAKAGLFRILSESSVAAGVRRIEGTTGLGVLKELCDKQELLHVTARELKAQNIADLPKRVAQLQNELKEAQKEAESLQAKLAESQVASFRANAKEVNGITYIAQMATGLNLDGARAVCDQFKSESGAMVTVLAVNCDGRLNFVCTCTRDAVARGAHAGNLLKTISVIAGGNGGGRPDSATSGAKDASKMQDALNAVEGILAAL
jgi:alanyl-tRNA synthetase